MIDGVDYNKPARGWLIAIYVFAILGGLLGVCFAVSVANSKIQLENGEKVYKYRHSDRVIARIGGILAVISAFIWKLFVMN